MIILVLVLASVAVALMRGGRLANLGRLEFRFIYLLYLPIILQAVVYSPLPHLWNINILGTPYVYVFSMLIGVGVLLLNLHIPGLFLVLLGLLCNLLVIEANGGYMPVSMEAREFAGMGAFTGVDTNLIEMTADTEFWFLGDIISTPRGVPGSNVYSVGDVLITIGGLWFIQAALVSSSRPTPDSAKDSVESGGLAG
ncbi:MAG TPA: DUF5317 domain-containing protein [Anaerolineae bacterium]